MKQNYATVMVKVLVMFAMALTEVHAYSITDNNNVKNISDTVESLLVDNHNLNEYDYRLGDTNDSVIEDTNLDGIGCVQLPKNIVNGKNVLTQNMLLEANTRYVIQYDYDMNDEENAIPKDCILDFKVDKTEIESEVNRSMQAKSLLQTQISNEATRMQEVERELQNNYNATVNGLGMGELLFSSMKYDVRSTSQSGEKFVISEYKGRTIAFADVEFSSFSIVGAIPYAVIFIDSNNYVISRVASFENIICPKNAVKFAVNFIDENNRDGYNDLRMVIQDYKGKTTLNDKINVLSKSIEKVNDSAKKNNICDIIINETKSIIANHSSVEFKRAFTISSKNKWLNDGVSKHVVIDVSNKKSLSVIGSCTCAFLGDYKTPINGDSPIFIKSEGYTERFKVNNVNNIEIPEEALFLSVNINGLAKGTIIKLDDSEIRMTEQEKDNVVDDVYLEYHAKYANSLIFKPNKSIDELLDNGSTKYIFHDSFVRHENLEDLGYNTDESLTTKNKDIYKYTTFNTENQLNVVLKHFDKPIDDIIKYNNYLYTDRYLKKYCCAYNDLSDVNSRVLKVFNPQSNVLKSNYIMSHAAITAHRVSGTKIGRKQDDTCANISFNVVDINNYSYCTLTNERLYIYSVNEGEETQIASISVANGELLTIVLYPSTCESYVDGKLIYTYNTNAFVRDSYCGLLFKNDNITCIDSMFCYFIEDFENSNFDNMFELKGQIDESFGVGSIPPLEYRLDSDGVDRFGIKEDNTNGSNKSLRTRLKYQPELENSDYKAKSELIVNYTRLTGRYSLDSYCISYDFYLPDGYWEADVDGEHEYIHQLHAPDGHIPSESPSPSFAVGFEDGLMKLWLRSQRGFSSMDGLYRETIPIFRLPNYHIDDEYRHLPILELDKWHTLRLYAKEGYNQYQNPLCVVEIDGIAVVCTNSLNSYNGVTASYFSFGIYKSTWRSKPTNIIERVVYFDNVKYMF